MSLCRPSIVSRLLSFSVAAFFALAFPCGSQAMTADGAMITNYASATSYFGVAGATMRYTVSYNATAGVIVSCPVVWITKIVAPTTLAASQTATFTICAVNTSLQASAFNLLVSDRLPDNVAYVGGSQANWTTSGAWVLTHSSNNATWAAGEPPNGQTAAWYMHWQVTLGPNRSACVSFKATVQ